MQVLDMFKHLSFFFFFNDTATTEIYTLSLHDALPIFPAMQTTRCFLNNRFVRQPLNYLDRKSTRLNSSHQLISYAVFCLKKKKKIRSAPLAPNPCNPGAPACDWPPSPPDSAGLYRNTRNSPIWLYSRPWIFFFLMIGRPPRSTLFPHPTLFR